MKYLLVIFICWCSNAAAQTKPHLVRMAEIEVDSASLQPYMALLLKEVNLSIEREPGVIAIFPMQDPQQPTRIRLLEIYASRQAYEGHIQSPHFQHYKTSTQKMVKKLQLTDLKELDPGLLPKLFLKPGN